MVTRLREVMAEAETVREAQSKIQEQAPPDVIVLLETIEADGIPVTLEESGITAEEGFEKVQSSVPAGSRIVARKADPHTFNWTIEVKASEEHRARAAATADLAAGWLIKDIRVTAPSSAGFLGMGRRQNRYRLALERHGFLVQITYQCDARVRAWLGDPGLVPVLTVMKMWRDRLGGGRCEVCGRGGNYRSLDGRNICESCLNLRLGRRDWPELNAVTEQELSRAADAIPAWVQGERGVSTGTLAHILNILQAPEPVRQRATKALIDFANAHNERGRDIDNVELAGSRALIAHDLGLLNTTLGIEELSRWLDDWSSQTRAEAALALGYTGSPRAIQPLGAALGKSTRINAAMCLLWIRDPGVNEVFAQFSPANWAGLNEYVRKMQFPPWDFCHYCRLPAWWAEDYDLPDNPALFSPFAAEPKLEDVVQAILTVLNAVRTTH